MFGIEFTGFSPWVNGVIFLTSAAIIWSAGTKISVYADGISERTGLGQAVVGLLFLALATSMPEIGTTTSAAASGNASLATNNIFGSITLQTVVLAVVDVWIVRGALTFFTPRPTLLLQGTLLVLLLGLVLAATAAGEFLSLFGVGLWSVILLLSYVVAVYLTHHYESNERWHASDHRLLDEVEARTRAIHSEAQRTHRQWSLARLLLFFALGSAAIFLAGFSLARVGEALAEQTGLGSSFFGAVFLAGATSLPELSSTVSAARLGNFSMAVSNIFGSNALMVMLIFVADLFYRQGPILGAVGNSALFGAAMGVVVTAVYLAGVIEWRDRTILGMGVDSVVIFLIYAGNLAVLYMLR